MLPGPGGSNIERVSPVQDEVHGLRQLLPLDARHELPRRHLEYLNGVPRFVGDVQMLAVLR